MSFYWKFIQSTQNLPQVPAAIAVTKQEGYGYLGSLWATGVQIYRLGNDGVWHFIRPEANLFIEMRYTDVAGTGSQSVCVASHFGTLAIDGSGTYVPNWKQLHDPDDDSGVQAVKVASVDAKDPRNLPWLKLQVTQHFGQGSVNNKKGVFGGTSIIQRIETVGGVAPRNVPEGAAPGVDFRVHYSATYCFWGSYVSATGGL